MTLHRWRKLPPARMQELRAAYRAGDSLTSMMTRFGVNRATVYYHLRKTAKIFNRRASGGWEQKQQRSRRRHPTRIGSPENAAQ